MITYSCTLQKKMLIDFPLNKLYDNYESAFIKAFYKLSILLFACLKKMSRDSITIYDVAKEAGVSISTVSRVLNAPHNVNTATRNNVLEVIDRLGYTPKAEARARALRETGRIGVITPFFTAPSFVQRLRGIAKVISASNYELVIYTVDSQSRLESYLRTLPITRNVDGLIIISLSFPGEIASKLIDMNMQTVVIENPQEQFTGVEIDNVQGGRIAARYLLKKGHTRIAFIGDTALPEYAIHPSQMRLQGFKEELASASAPIPQKYIQLTPYTQADTRKAAHHLFDLSEPPTAIFAATDFQAVGVLKAARDQDLEVPGDIAVLGFDDLDMAEYFGLTTIRQPLDESGRIAAELLISRLSNPEQTQQHVQLPLAVVERDTV